MADYDLGTAHGRIVVDYDDKGIKRTKEDLETLENQAKSLLGRFATMAKDWRSHGKSMRDTAANVARGVGLITGVAIAAHTAMHGFGASFGLLREAHGLVGELGTALGAIPDGMENFPTAIQRVVRLNAAVAVLTGTLGLLARSTSSLRGIRVITGLLGGFGARITALAAPLRLVSRLAFGFVTILRAFSLVKTIIKVFGALNLVLGALGGTIHVVSGLAASIRDLSKALLLLPALIGAGALAMGTFKIATQGVGDALKAMEDPAKFAEALRKLSPAARAAVTEVQKLVKPFKELQQSVQEKFFEGLGPVISQLGALYLPKLRVALEAVAGSFNRTIKEVAAFFNTFEGSNEVANDFAEGLAFSAKGIDNLMKAVAPLVESLYLIWRVGAEVFAEITGGAGAAAQKFREFIGEARASGQLRVWMLQGVQAVKDLIAVVINLGRIFTTVFDGLNQGSGQTFLGFLRQATERMLAFLKSAEGQRVLAVFGTMLEKIYQNGVKMADAFVKYILPAIEAFLPFIERMSTAVGDGLVGAMAVLGPVFQALGTVLSALSPILGPIVTALVFLTTTGIGLAVAAGILSKALLLLRVGLLAVRAAAAVAGFAFRLITGSLGPAERAILRFIGLVGRRLVGALAAAARSSRLLKFGGLAAGVGLLAVELDKFNIAAAGGDPAKLTGLAENLHDLVEAGKQIAAGDFSGIFADMKAEVTALGQTWRDGKAPIQEWSASATIALGNFATTAGVKIGEAVTWIQGLPGRIGTAIATFGLSLYNGALQAWEQFRLATEQKFIELGGTVGSLPYRIGVAIGSLIGMALKWAQDTWESFKQGTIQKFNEIVADAQALPGKIGAAISNLAGQLQAKAQEAWESFKQRAKQKGDEAAADARALPGKVAAGLASLAGLLATKAVAAWQSFKTSAIAKGNEIMADARALPGKIVSAVGNVGNLLVNAGRSIIDGLLAGIRRGVQAMYDFVSGIAAGIAARKGPIAKDRVLLRDEGAAIINGLTQGMRSAMPGLWGMIRNINGDLSGIGGAADNFNLTGRATVAAATSGALAPMRSGLTPRGGDGATAPVEQFSIGKVEIPAKDVAEMKSVAEFFDSVKQRARAGKASR